MSRRDTPHINTPNIDTPEVDALLAQLCAARKYATIDATLARHLLAAELAKGRSGKAALKAVKSKLHQVTGAYQVGTPDYAELLQRMRTVRQDDAALRGVCREAMRFHASTKERLAGLDEFYATLFVNLPPAPSVVDLACGLNPLALAWMRLPTGFSYWACDIDPVQMHFLNQFFALLNLPASAHVFDLVHGDLETLPAADVVLLFKTLPCLAQIDARIGPRLLDALRCRVAFVSFPTRSLGGRQRGMAAHYGDRFAAIIPPGYTVQRYEFAQELVFRLDRVEG